MNTNFTLKNFRIFDKEGICIPLRPITILTGCNNSGKSSITKALCLLKNFCQQVEADFEDGKQLKLESYKIDFHKKPNDILGSFDLIVHHVNEENEVNSKNEQVKDSRYVTFEIVVESSWLLQDVVLQLEFAPLELDELNNGYLHSYTIRTLDGQCIYKALKGGKGIMDFSIVKKSLLCFLYGQHAFASWQNELTYRMATSTYPADKDEEAEEFEKSMNSLLKDMGGVALIYMLEWQVSHCHQPWKDGLTGAATSILKNVEKSFNNSPNLNVFCYFPCLELLQNTPKKEIRKVINDKIQSQETKVDQFNQKIIDLFLDSFEESETETLHDFISQKENVLFIDNDISSFAGDKFPFPMPAFFKHEFSSYLFEEVELPEKANWTICIIALDVINRIMTNSNKKYVDYDNVNDMELHKLENSISDYLRKAIEDIFSKIMPGTFTYSPTTIVRPQRLYSLEDESDFTNTLKKYLEIKRLWISEVGNNTTWKYEHKDKERHQPCSFINKWLYELGIAHHVDIKTHANGYGATIHLYDNKNDDKGMLLADKGFGVLQLFAFLLKIENAILESQINEVRYPYYTNGLSKEMIKYMRNYNNIHPLTIALEEPECHLHPSLQSKFADIIADANIQYGIHFLIESHSEYFIRRLQLIVSQQRISNDEVSLLYVNPQKRPSYIPAITDIGIEPDGTLRNEFGSGFFDESVRLSNELFKNKKGDDEE